MNETIELAQNFKRFPGAANAKEWPKRVRARFIEPGLVRYDDMGTVLVTQETLNRMRESFKGKPVIDEQHADAKPENFREVADGMVTDVYHDPGDGWEWAVFYVWDEDTLRHCQSGEYSVSCAYTPTKVTQEGGKHNNIEYDGEFLDGVYTHLAIVKDPRYEQAKIVMNSKGEKSMFKLFGRKTVENEQEVDGKTTFMEIDGNKVPLAELVASHEALNSRSVNLTDDSVIVVNGKEVTGKELKKAYLAQNKKTAKNKEEGMETGDQKEAEEAEEKEGKKLDKGEKKNDIEEESVEEDTKKRDKTDKEAKNSLEEREEPGKHAREFAQVAEMRNNDPAMPSINTMADRLALGKNRYGKDRSKEAA